MTYRDDPIDYRMMAATFERIEIKNHVTPGESAKDSNPGSGTSQNKPARTAPEKPDYWNLHDVKEPVRIGSTEVTAFEVYHGTTPCYAYKIRHNNAVFVFCTDHELRHGSDPDDPRQIASEAAEKRLIEHCRDVDAAYFDGQNLLEEYCGHKDTGASYAVSRMDWGHSCIEDVVARAHEAGVKRCYVGHHDPDRQWVDRFRIDQELQAQSAGSGCHIELAKDRFVLDL